MRDQEKTRAQLLKELKELRQRVVELETLEVERKPAREALGYADSIVATVREPLVVLDADLRVKLANRPFYRTFLTSPQDMENCFIYEVGNRQWDIPRLRQLLEDILPHNNSFENFEVEHEFPTIGQRTMLLNARRVYGKAGETLLILLAIEDITERKKAEEKIKEHTAQLEAANKELDAFSYSVSHDLRAPLRAVDGFSRILIEEYQPQLPLEAQRYLQLARDNTQLMGRLIDDLLAFSHLSRQPLKVETVVPADLVRQTLEDLSLEQEGRRVEITIGELPPCQADPAMLKQVFVNLLSNALKFTRKREAAVIEIGCREQNGERVYFIRDNGVGFDMQYAHKLFGVFQRLHRAEEYEGTGVGLAIVHRIIRRHGGRVWAEAEVDKGAAFYFTLEGGNQV